MGADVAENDRTVKEARGDGKPVERIKRYIYEARQRINRMQQYPDQEPLEWVGCYAICIVDDESF